MDSLTDADRKAIADICPAIPSADGALFLSKNLEKLQPDAGALTGYLRHIARYGTPEALDAAAVFGRKHANGDLKQDLALFKAIQEGSAQRGGPMSDGLRVGRRNYWEGAGAGS